MQANDAADDANPESRGGDLNARVRGAGGRACFSLLPLLLLRVHRSLDLHRGAGRKKGRSSARSVNGRARVQSFALAPRVGRRRKREGGREGGSHNNETALVCAHTYLVYVPKSHCIAALWVCMRRLFGRFVRPRCPLGERGKNEEGRRAIATVAGADAGGYGAGAGEGMQWIGEAAPVP